MNVFISEHAYQRAKERLNWKKKTLNRMIDRIVHQGILHTQTHGELKLYLNKKLFEYGNANKIIIYGNHMYVFFNDVLITIFQLPLHLRGSLAYV